MSNHVTNSSDGSNNNLRLNYLYQNGEIKEYGRKFYIFPATPSVTTGDPLYGQAASATENSSLNQTEPSEHGSRKAHDSHDIHQRVERLSQLLRAERQNCREHEDTIFTLRRLVDEHERRMHHMDGIGGDTILTLRRLVDEQERRMHHMDGIGGGVGSRTEAANFTRMSPTQKLLDQVKRLQKQKIDLLLQVARYDELPEPRNSPLSGEQQTADPSARTMTVNGSNRSTAPSETDVGCTDTEKELHKVKALNRTLELEVKKLAEENGLLRQQVSSTLLLTTTSERESLFVPKVSKTSSTSSLSQIIVTATSTSISAVSESASMSQSLVTTTSTTPSKQESTPSTPSLPEMSETREILVTESGSEVAHSVKTPCEDDGQILCFAQERTVSLEQKLTTECKTCQTDDEVTVYSKYIDISAIEKRLELCTSQLSAKEAEMLELRDFFLLEKEMASREKMNEIEQIKTAKDAEIECLRRKFTEINRQILQAHQELRDLRSTYDNLRQCFRESVQENSQHLKDIKNTMKECLIDLGVSHDHVMARYRKEMLLRQKYHNQLVELRGNIRVLCRLRPWIEEDGSSSDRRPAVQLDPDDDGLVMVSSKGRLHPFDLDKAFGMDSTQAEVFEEVSSLVRSTMDGYNVCIFAYGQTGSGKTYTMEGPPSEPGIQQRAIEQLFQESTDPDWDYTISASMLEIYNETIIDLLDPEPRFKLEAKLQSDGSLHIPGLTQVPVKSVQEVLQVFSTGREHRATESTSMNTRSSRSHCLLCITVLGQNLVTASKTSGRLNLVDLAGSERLSRSQADGERLREAKNINRSLACLGDVIHALRSRHKHVPYRNSKLTYLLQDSLGGNGKTLMIIQVAPGKQNVRETLCTLTFGQRVTAVKLGSAVRHKELMSTDSTYPAWRRPANLDLSFSSTSSTCSSPFSSPSSSPCPSPSLSPSSFEFPSPSPSPAPSSSPVKSLRRTASTSSAYPAWRRQLSTPVSVPRSHPSPSATQTRFSQRSALKTRPPSQTTQGENCAARPRMSSRDTAPAEASLDSTPTTSRSASPNETPTTTPTSSPKPLRKLVTVKLRGTTLTTAVRKSAKSNESARSSTAVVRPVGVRWR
ncbi:hypothetical protein RRG08_016748 [Elysia crispata]|uniref:Kinesin motor domain-containing protein n=1 Tax=Elysia crispata TaxID=231223 RepID=A0AAE0ZX38_9GAST|nr:hypothetical protein RRG08_016748 [Elysia crispata]